MGKVVKSVGGALGIGGGAAGAGNVKLPKYTIDRNAFQETGADTRNNLEAFRTNQAAQAQGVDNREFRAGQTSLAQALTAQANGQGPSLAQNQLKSATDRNLAQQLALAASSRGGNAALNQRQLMRNQATTNQQMAGQSADLRLQEQQQAQMQLADVLNQSRSQDMGFQAQNAQSQLATNQMLQQIAEANRQALIAREQLGVNQQLGIAGVKQSGANAQAQADAQLTGGLISGIGAAFATPAAAAASDEKLKTEVKDGGSSVDGFLKALEAKSYKYKDEKFGEGEQLGVMAQDLEKAGPVGKQMVVDTPEGKIVDFGKGFGAILAAQAEMHRRMEKLEKMKKRG